MMVIVHYVSGYERSYENIISMDTSVSYNDGVPCYEITLFNRVSERIACHEVKAFEVYHRDLEWEHSSVFAEENEKLIKGLKEKLDESQHILDQWQISHLDLVDVNVQRVIDERYFVDKDKRAECILQQAQSDMARDILDHIMSEDLIAWENCYDPCQMRYIIRGRLLIGAPKGRNTWMRGNLKGERS